MSILEHAPLDHAPPDHAPPDDAGEADGGERFPKHLRLRKTPEFQRVYDAKNRAGDGVLLVFGAPNDLVYQGRPVTRVGLSVSRKNGNAVARNLVKRRLREAFRRCRPKLPAGWDFVLIPRPHAGAGRDRFAASLVRLAAKLPGRLSRGNQQRPTRGAGRRGERRAKTERPAKTERGRDGAAA